MRQEATGKVGYINELKAEHLFSLDNIELSKLADRKEIYFLGENGDGKSLILMSIILAFKGNFIEHISDYDETGRILDLIRANADLSLKGKDSEGNIYQFVRNKKGATNSDIIHLENVLAYGVHRSRNNSDKISQYGFMTLFDSEQFLISPEKFLKDLYLRELERQTQKFTGGSSISLETAKNIIADLVEKNVEISIDSSGVTYVERGTPLKFFQLSEGYKSVITWTCDLIARLTEKQTAVTSIQDLTGVVLVDEIGLHLHPRWEKIIVKKLRTWFPKIQFFFTTHSPVTILGASNDAVFYRVYKEDGKTNISEPYFKEGLNELMANSVLTSPLFGLEDARMVSGEASQKDLDTSDDYLHSRIHQKISIKLQQEKSEGKRSYFSKSEIDSMIDDVMNEEVSKLS